MAPSIQPFFDAATSTWTYVVHGGHGTPCAVIDPVLDFDAKSGCTRTDGAQKVADFIRRHALRLEWILETHAHADHLSAAAWLQEELGGRIAIGAGIPRVQEVFRKLFHLDPDFTADGSQFDRLLAEGDSLELGDLRIEVLATPGHTPACVSYRVGDAVFVGDTLFPPDVGTARCDFPGGSARDLYHSVRRILALPPGTRLYMCHDYPPEGRTPRCETSVAEHRAANIHLRDGTTEADFVDLRTRRDAGLQMPNLILPAIQVNIRAGRLPPPEANGVSYLKIPVNGL